MDNESTISQTGSRRGIQSIEIGLRVIDALKAADGPLTLKELAHLASLPISNCHRYCVSFVRAGYMRQDGRAGRYEAGPGLIQAGIAALARTDAVGAATEALEVVVDETGETGQLAIWSDRGPTIIRWIPGRMAVRTSIAAGSALPLLTSATGRVFLAFLPTRQTGIIASREAVISGIDPAAFAERTRSLGFGQVAGDHIPGLSAIAVPVLDAFGEAAAVMSLVRAGDSMPFGALESLRRGGAAASERLGWVAGRSSPARID